jgi:hypothetical protein
MSSSEPALHRSSLWPHPTFTEAKEKLRRNRLQTAVIENTIGTLTKQHKDGIAVQRQDA